MRGIGIEGFTVYLHASVDCARPPYDATSTLEAMALQRMFRDGTSGPGLGGLSLLSDRGLHYLSQPPNPRKFSFRSPCGEADGFKPGHSRNHRAAAGGADRMAARIARRRTRPGDRRIASDAAGWSRGGTRQSAGG